MVHITNLTSVINIDNQPELYGLDEASNVFKWNYSAGEWELYSQQEATKRAEAYLKDTPIVASEFFDSPKQNNQ